MKDNSITYTNVVLSVEVLVTDIKVEGGGARSSFWEFCFKSCIVSSVLLLKYCYLKRKQKDSKLLLS